MKKTSALRASAAIGLGGALALGGLAAPALADSGQWMSTGSLEAYISGDASSDYVTMDDVEGDTEGWTGGAFDRVGTLDVTYCNGQTDQFGDGPNDVLFKGETVGTDGSQVFKFLWTMDTECGDLDVQATVSAKGNYLRWEYKVLGDEDAQLAFYADSDYSDAEWSTIGKDAVVGSDSSSPSTPQAWKFASDQPGAQVSANGSSIMYSGTDDGTYLTATVALVDSSYETGNAEAVHFLNGIASTLDQSYGDSYPVFYGTDAPAFKATQGTVGQALDTDVAYEYSGIPYEDGDYFFLGNQSTWTSYEVSGLPEGVSLEVTFNDETGRPIVHVSGTPAESGSFPVALSFFHMYTEDDWKYRVLNTTLTVDIAAADAAPAAVDNTKKLAETGFEGAPVGFGALALLVLGFGVLGARRVRKA